jgi:hypothetical protein
MAVAAYPVKIIKKYNGSVEWDSEDTVEASGTQAYVEGNLVKVAASAAVTELSTADATAILGVAKTTATGTTSTKAIVSIVEPGDILEMSLVNGSTTLVLGTLADLYKKYGIYVSGHETYLDQNSATFAQVVAIVKDKNGAYTSRVWVQPIATTLAVATGL